MGNRATRSDEKRRHTVTSGTPYIKQHKHTLPTLPKLSQIKSTQTNTSGIQATYDQKFDAKRRKQHKMVRSVSTPISNESHSFKQATFDFAASTKHQHLVSSNNVKKKNKYISFKSSPKLKTRSFVRSHSSIPYIHFNDDSNEQQQKKKKKSLKFMRESVEDDSDLNEIDDDISHLYNDIQRKKQHRKLHKYHINNSEIETNKHRKILLLGNGSCGKTTIFRQFKLILGEDKEFDQNELAEATAIIRQNCVSVLLIVLHKALALYQSNCGYFADCAVDEKNDAIRESINFVMQYRTESFEKCDDVKMSELASALSFLWNLKCVQTAIKHRHKRFCVPDNICYFYDQIETVFGIDYVPSIDDVIKLRIRTTGMIEHSYKILADNNCDEYKLSIFDTGGERNERKKWVHTFERVDVVIFVAALSHFCCVLWEDGKTISMHDAIELFSEICNGRWFRRSEMILFLNKNDIFRQMLYDEISLSVGFGHDVRTESYPVKVDHDEITPPPSPNLATNCLTFMDVANGHGNDEKEVSDEGKNEKNGFVPFAHLNAWTGKKWNGPNYKYDSNKSVEENNAYFEKCYDKAIEFIYRLFLESAQNRDKEKTVYVHITTAVSTESIRETFDNIKTLIVNSNYAEHSNLLF